MSDSLMSMIQDENVIADLAKQLVASMVEASMEMYSDDPDWGVPTKEMISNRSMDYAADVLNDFKQSVLEEMQLYLANITIKTTKHVTLTVIDN
jgi:hypothetical protein